MTAAAIYVRISDDRAGDALGVRRQEDDCRTLCTQLGWDATAVFVDNDTSAFSGRRRPGYEDLLDALKNSHVDAVVAWHPDRLHRSPTELETFIDLIEATGAQVATVRAGTYDLATATGRMMARVVGATARYESELKSERTRRKHLELAQAGKPVGGGRPFGYEQDRITINEREAELLRQAAARVLAGDSLRAIAINWNAAGIHTTKGGPWRSHALRRVLISPRVAGLRALGDTIVAPGTWPPVLDQPTWERVRATIFERGAAPFPRVRRYLLPGFLRCWKCARPLVARGKGERRRTYVCSSGPDQGGCGGVRIIAPELEAYVVDRVLARLASPELAARLVDVDTAGDERALLTAIEDLDGRVGALDHDHYVTGVLPRSRWLAATQTLERERDALRRRLGRLRQRDVLQPDGQVWDGSSFGELSLDRQRAVLREVIDHITIGPGQQGRNRFDPGRTTISWR